MWTQYSGLQEDGAHGRRYNSSGTRCGTTLEERCGSCVEDLIMLSTSSLKTPLGTSYFLVFSKEIGVVFRSVVGYGPRNESAEIARNLTPCRAASC